MFYGFCYQLPMKLLAFREKKKKKLFFIFKFFENENGRMVRHLLREISRITKAPDTRKKYQKKPENKRKTATPRYMVFWSSTSK